MTRDDVEAFRDRMRELCAVFGKSCTKELVQAYWTGLKDIPFGEFERNVQDVIRSATQETKWPRPAQLRDAPPPRSRAPDPHLHELEKRSAISLEELRHRDLAEWKRVMAGRPCVRLVEQEGSENVFFDPEQWCWRRVPRYRSGAPT